jgi:anthranilate synthase component 1
MRRVIRQTFDGWVDPAAAFVALHSGAAAAFWLDGGAHAESGMSYLGAATRVATAAELEAGVLPFLRAELAAERIEADAATPGFALGWVGWLGYELRAETMRVAVDRTSRYPDAALMFVDRALAFDHAAGTVTLLSLHDDPLWAESTVATLRRAAAPRPTPAPPRTASWRYSDSDYLSMIRSCMHAIADGEAYQLCLTTEATVNGAIDPLSTYLALRESSPTHHGAYLVMGEVAVLGASPERFLSVSPDGLIESKPIKGTRPRGVTEAEDEALRAELLGSDKERAENLMIVDLMRNDLGRVSAIGSVSVPALLQMESYAQVHQLVSTVRGELADGLTGVDAVAACFPAGSMTGAPKRSATLILDGLEQRARGIFSGALGYFGLDGAIDLAMVIRSIVIDRDGATVGAGGGITALSIPEEELAEVKLKAAAMLGVLGVREQTARSAV